MYYFASQENSVATKREFPFKVKSTFSKYFCRHGFGSRNDRKACMQILSVKLCL